MMQPATITVYSDILCVWAYISERRLREVQARFGESVKLERRCCSVFGDTVRKIGEGWKDRGGYAGFNAHLRSIAARFPDVPIHPDLWLEVRPASSTSAHLFLAAARTQSPPDGNPDDLLSALRVAFFQQALDISRRDVQCQIAEEIGFDSIAIEQKLRQAEPYACFSRDLEDAARAGVQGSPTLVLNDGRQKLHGNVGYRIIEANIQELLRSPQADEASWC
jgi:predicted DsbA family dithiol-disulfide isomerase